MEERSLRIYQEKTFFSKISNTITKILTPTKIGINGMLISIKRNNALKAYETYKANENIENQEKQEATEKKFEDVYALYLVGQSTDFLKLVVAYGLVRKEKWVKNLAHTHEENLVVLDD